MQIFIAKSRQGKLRAQLMALLLALLVPLSAPDASFVAFESGPVRPLAMSPDGNRLFAVNTPDNRLEIFDVTPEGLHHAAFKKFNVAFEGLLGRSGQLSPTEMQAFTDFILQISLPPNPIRSLSNSLSPSQLNGRNFYFNTIVDTLTCNGCHVLDSANGFFGSDGRSSFEGEPQHFKVPHLRNMYQKVGMFGMPDVQFFQSGDNAHTGDQVRGFGFLHDGSVDTLFRFLNATLFSFSNDTQRRDMEAFLLAFDTNLAPIVGQQITLTPYNRSLVDARIDLMIARDQQGECDVIVKGNPGNVAQFRGAYRLPDGTFQTDSSGVLFTDAQLRDFSGLNSLGLTLTYTCVPSGAGQRMGVDRDEDGVFDADDNCPVTADANQVDTDGDGEGDPCDTDDDNDGLPDVEEIRIGSNPLVADSDGDGLSDGFEAAYDGEAGIYTPGQDLNPDSTDTDVDGFADDVELSYNSNPLVQSETPANGDLNEDGRINVADVALGHRISLGELEPTMLQSIRGDIAPRVNGIPVPDGDITAADVLLIEKMVLGGQ